jgi:hypothetical protein
VQLNDVIAGGDEAAYTGVSGNRDDALLPQFQLLARKLRRHRHAPPAILANAG